MVGGNRVGGFGGPPKPTGQRPVLPMLMGPNQVAVDGPTARAAQRWVGEAAFINHRDAKRAEAGTLETPSRNSRIQRFSGRAQL
jgi:hypothetical protein